MGRVFIHLGLAKTGTSFLQKKVFPCLDDVDYFHTGHYDVLNKKPVNGKKMLLSFEGLSGTILSNDRFINAFRIKKFKRF